MHKHLSLIVGVAAFVGAARFAPVRAADPAYQKVGKIHIGGPGAFD